jgi:undecaprenyl pyrophosphate phosphatase UppP
MSCSAPLVDTAHGLDIVLNLLRGSDHKAQFHLVFLKFLPAVCGAMYGGILGASAVLGYAGSLRMVLAFLSEFATSLKARMK